MPQAFVCGPFQTPPCAGGGPFATTAEPPATPPETVTSGSVKHGTAVPAEAPANKQHQK